MDTIRGATEKVLIIESPPRHGKSEFISRWLPAWYLGRFPDRRVILASYEANFARSWGRKARMLLQEHGPGFFGVSVSTEIMAATDWGIAGREGGMVTAGVGGPITGRGAHLLIIDDPIKNAEEAVSQTMRDKQWDWWQSTARTRLEPGGAVVIVATRWHEEDLSGRLIRESESGDGPKVRRLNMPAIAEDGDQLGRAPGMALWPEQWPVNELEKLRIGMDIYWWLALFQQRPGRGSRACWPDEYFGEHIHAEHWPDRFELSALAIDPSKGKSGRKGDYSAIVFAGLTGGLLYIDAWIERRPIERIVSDAIEMIRVLQPDIVTVEGNQWQDTSMELEFARQGRERAAPPISFMPVYNHENKEDIRISRLGPHLLQKKLRFRQSPGCKLLIEQLREFPLAAHDDGPDALEMAIRSMNQFVAAAARRV